MKQTTIMDAMKQSSALIGHTGLVGSNLTAQRRFDRYFNSKNSNEMAGLHFDEVICAGVSGTKWMANAHPDADWQAISCLLKNLRKLSASRMILISTIDVYGSADSRADESHQPYSEENHAYGKHRQRVEQEIQEMFSEVMIVRLPGIYGLNLKKNLLFDLITDHEVSRHGTDSAYQWYWLKYLHADIETAKKNRIKILNLFPAPVRTQSIIEQVFGDKYEVNEAKGVVKSKHPAPETAKPVMSNRYDIRTRYGQIFGQPADVPYRFSTDEVIEQIATFRAAWSPRKQHSAGQLHL